MKKMLLFFVLVILFLPVLQAAGAPDYYNSGMSFMNKGDYKKAFSFFNYAAKLDPKNPVYYEKIGECYEKLGNKAMAAKYKNYAASMGNGGTQAGSYGKEGKINVSFFTGFTTVSMSKINDDTDKSIDTALAFIKMFDPTASASKAKLGGGFLVGADGGYTIIPGLSAGLRLEYISALAAKSSITSTLGGMDMEFSGSIIPVLVGASYKYSFPKMPLSASGGLYLGYGMGGVNMVSTGGGSSQTVNYGGGAMAVEINADADYKISSMLSAGLKLGYRMANIGKLTANADSGSVKKGDVLQDSSGADMPADFSGLIIAVEAKANF